MKCLWNVTVWNVPLAPVLLEKETSVSCCITECCKGDDQSQWRMANFDPPQPLSPLTDLHQNWQRWLCRGYLPPRKILFTSDKGFRFRACATSRTIGDSAIFFGGSGNHLQPRRHHGHRRKIRHKTRFCARMCLLGVPNHTLTSTPPFSLKPPFWGPIMTVLRNYRPKTALALEVLIVNDP